MESWIVKKPNHGSPWVTLSPQQSRYDAPVANMVTSKTASHAPDPEEAMLVATVVEKLTSEVSAIHCYPLL